MDNQNRYDAIVIGSGIGGLTAAVLLAKLENRRVLVLERHFQPGGQTHSFVRKGRFNFDVGVHYIGNMAPGEMPRKVMDFVTGGKVNWNPLPPVIERFVYPDLTFEVPNDPVKYRGLLAALFPAEGEALDRYFRDVKNAGKWFGFRFAANGLPATRRALMRGAYSLFGGLARMTTKEYLDGNFRDPRLKGLLCSQWGDYGLPPGQSAFGMHALLADHFLKGGWYPEGGAGKIAEAAIPAIEARGGLVRTGITVERIIVRNGRAEGVRCLHAGGEEEFFAPVIISDAGARNTYLHLLPPDVDVPFRRELEDFPSGQSVFVVYMGLKESPSKLGFTGGNTWVYDSYDHDANAAPWGADPRFSHYFLSFPSLKDPAAKAHTAEVVVTAHYGEWQRWAGKGWRKRDRAYYDFKKEMAGRLIDKVEARFPGLKNIVETFDVSSPLTMEYFQGNSGGAFYGIPCVPKRLDAPFCSAITPVRGLYLAGQDALTPGVTGAMFGGVIAAAATGEVGGLFRLMGTLRRLAP